MKINRLIIIGNGFDLAHGLPTSYRDFIDDFWKNIITKHKEKEYENIVYVKDSRGGLFRCGDKIDNFNDFKGILDDYSNHYNLDYDKEKISCKDPRYPNDYYIFKFKNDFFKIITTQNSIQNWVDIENEYYKMLKECLKESDNTAIKKLNEEFTQVKILLEKYLKDKVQERFDFSPKAGEGIFEILNKSSYNDIELKKFQKEFSTKEEKGQTLQKQKGFENFTLENYFLSFNYTNTVKGYIRELGLTEDNLIEIHGSLSSAENPINFGFGDEMDKRYKEIEEQDDNEYLKNIKSFQYLHTSNYKRLLDLIDSDKFQVYIMGHSCGLSDRTLLNTIFEHENCISMKVFYYKNEDKDNYTEITQNISRHFNDKKMMRDKIVNKTLCDQLPQTKFSLKK